MLAILANSYDDEGRVKIELLDIVSLIEVSSESVTEAILGCLSSKDIPVSNLMSVLMDSCNVMRG